MTAARALHAVPGESAPGIAALDRVAAAEIAARSEVDRARRELPGRDPALYDCYLGQLVGNLAPTSEADPINILVSLLAAAGVMLGQGPHVQAGDDRHPLLVWPMIVGKTGGGRKGAGWSTARRALVAADADFMVHNVRTGLTSGEGLATMFAVSDDDEPEDENTRPAPGRLPPGDLRLFVYEVEWGGVMDRMGRVGNSLSAMLRSAWEGGDLSTMNVNARVAPSSHLAVLAHITPEEFRSKVRASDLAGGTYNRFLPVAVARSKFLPLSTGADQDLVTDLGASLANRVRHGAKLGAIGLTADAAALWHGLYVEFGSEHSDDHGPVGQFLSRTAPNCLRVAAIHAALDRKTAIDTDHLTAAAALVRYSIASARAVFNADPSLARLAAWIAEAATAGRTRTEISKEFFGGNKSADEVTRLLDQLTNTGHITPHKRPPASGRGRPIESFTATNPTN